MFIIFLLIIQNLLKVNNNIQDLNYEINSVSSLLKKIPFETFKIKLVYFF